MNFFKKEGLWNFLALVNAGAVTFLGYGISQYQLPGHSTVSMEEAAFGADFYTDIYEAVNTINTNIRLQILSQNELAAVLFHGMGYLMMGIGAISFFHYLKALFASRKGRIARSQAWLGSQLEPEAESALQTARNTKAMAESIAKQEAILQSLDAALKTMQANSASSLALNQELMGALAAVMADDPALAASADQLDDAQTQAALLAQAQAAAAMPNESGIAEYVGPAQSSGYSGPVVPSLSVSEILTTSSEPEAAPAAPAMYVMPGTVAAGNMHGEAEDSLADSEEDKPVLKRKRKQNLYL